VQAASQDTEGTVDRSVLAHPLFANVSMAHLASLVEDLPGVGQPRWRGGGAAWPVTRWCEETRAGCVGARCRLLFVDRLVVMSAYWLNLPGPHDLVRGQADSPAARLASCGFGVLFNVDCTTVTRAVGETRRLLAERFLLFPTGLACGFERWRRVRLRPIRKGSS
jgi:hypothetical protein